MESPQTEIKGIYLGERGENFKRLITGLLKKGKLKATYIDILTSPENMEFYGNAFTSSLVDSKYNYEVLEQIGDVIGNQFIVTYIYRRFKQLRCSAGVKVTARLRINYGSKTSFCSIAEKEGFWPFISATNDLRLRKKKDLLEDVFEAFLGATSTIMDEQVHLGLGNATVYKILATIFDEFPISLRYEDLYDAKTRLKELFDLHGEKLGPLIYEETKEDDGTTMSFAYRLDGAVYDTRTDGTVNMNKIKGRYRRILIGKGCASMKADAQQLAASNALQLLATQGYVKHAPAIYARFAENSQKQKASMADVLRICESREKINDLFFTRGKSKYQSKYMSTTLAHYCRERDMAGIKLCLTMEADPNVFDTDGQSCLDLLLIGTVDESLVKEVISEFLKHTDVLNIHENVFEHYYSRYKSSFFSEVEQNLNKIENNDVLENNM